MCNALLETEINWNWNWKVYNSTNILFKFRPSHQRKKLNFELPSLFKSFPVRLLRRPEPAPGPVHFALFWLVLRGHALPRCLGRPTNHQVVLRMVAPVKSGIRACHSSLLRSHLPFHRLDIVRHQGTVHYEQFGPRTQRETKPSLIDTPVYFKTLVHKM